MNESIKIIIPKEVADFIYENGYVEYLSSIEEGEERKQMEYKMALPIGYHHAAGDADNVFTIYNPFEKKDNESFLVQRTIQIENKQD